MAKSKKSVDPVMPSMPDNEDYKTKSAFDDLMRAEEHKKNPDLMKKVMKHARLQRKSIKNIQGGFKSLDDVKDYANKKYGSDSMQVDSDEDDGN